MQEFMEVLPNTVVQGDVRDVLRTPPDESVHCIITSPPYWGLRDYGTADWQGGDPACDHRPARKNGTESSTLQGSITGNHEYEGFKGDTCPRCGARRVDRQLGLEATPEEYIAEIVAIFHECRRVLRSDGTLWLNMGDCYASSVNGRSAAEDDRTFRDKPFSTAVSGLKPKDLVGMPWRLALALQADGWWLRSDIIWHKPNPMPESVTDRPTKAHEYVFLLTKSGNPLYWTHRDLPGTRSKPAPDWRWIHVSGQELTQPPDDPHWKRCTVECPDCGGSGWQTINYDDNGLFGGQSFRIECERCGGKKRIKAWEKVNLWRGHDYFYDVEAVREKTGNEMSWDEYYQATAPGASWPSGGKSNNAGAYKPDGGRAYPTGRNRRSVWTISTESFSGAHFATFPTKLVEPCILAGTSARGVCPACGAPWQRVVERTAMEINRTNNHPPELRTRTSGTMTKPPTSTTTGWRPTCDCHNKAVEAEWMCRGCKTLQEKIAIEKEISIADPVPALVLDPFFGSGTTGVVAIETGRHYLGIELNPDYIELARRRLAGAQPALIPKGLE